MLAKILRGSTKHARAVRMITATNFRGFKSDISILGGAPDELAVEGEGHVDLWKEQQSSNNALVLQTRDQVEEYVISLVRGYFLTTKKAQVTLESTMTEHGLDSLDMIELIIQIEDELGILVDAENLEKFTKPKHFVNFILNLEAYKREFHKLPTEGNFHGFDWQESFPGSPFGKKK